MRWWSQLPPVRRLMSLGGPGRPGTLRSGRFGPFGAERDREPHVLLPLVPRAARTRRFHRDSAPRHWSSPWSGVASSRPASGLAPSYRLTMASARSRVVAVSTHIRYPLAGIVRHLAPARRCSGRLRAAHRAAAAHTPPPAHRAAGPVRGASQIDRPPTTRGEERRRVGDWEGDLTLGRMSRSVGPAGRWSWPATWQVRRARPLPHDKDGSAAGRLGRLQVGIGRAGETSAAPIADPAGLPVRPRQGETTPSSCDTGHRPAPSVCGSVHASVDDPRDTRNGAGRSPAD
jgi:hypothetical protein